MASDPVTRPRVFLDIQVGTTPLGRIVFELFTDKTPKTCENFRTLCVNPASSAPLSYHATPFHRIIDTFMIQGGDTTRGDGTGGSSIYGAEFADEHLDWRAIDAAGLLCMANRGRDTNTSQFFVTLAPCPHLDGKHTVFGRVVTGTEVLERMAKMEVDAKDRPPEEVLISRCGELERKRKEPRGVSTKDARSGQKEGKRSSRRHRGSSSDVASSSSSGEEVRPSKRQRHDRHARRDDSLDRTRRGRSRARSYSNPSSPSSPLRKTSSTRQTPPPKPSHHTLDDLKRRAHKPRPRRRSQSPSRSRTPLAPLDTEVDPPDHPHRRRRNRSHSRERNHDADRAPRTSHLRHASSNDHGNGHSHTSNFPNVPSRRDLRRSDEYLLRREERDREGGQDRFDGAVGEDDVREWRGYGERRGRMMRDDDMVAERKENVTFKGRGRMSYREEGGGRLR
ncbi:MAG: hypothetical protein M1817_006266 [Caeruleum heppii]|nr:MAG: hypothetical protein M1817_006266 [Caeruleum heppii]